jgi:hypothetical protein
VTHGEADTARQYAATVQAETGWPASVPRYDQTVALE